MAVDIGDRVGNYWLISLLGKGGMGRVFVGEHVIMGRRAAIKVLRDGGKRTIQVERLFDEARAACRIEHPAIVEVLDCGVSAFAGPYMVMELLEGEPLSRALRGNPRPPLPWVASVLAQVADALDAAHEAGIVHRDLKPGNIFLLADGRVKLLDFGIARLLDAPAGVSQRRPMVVGTPLYMAPEQSRGEATTPAMDVYALGVIAFSMLTGQLPYNGEDSKAILEQHRVAPIPSARALVEDLAPAGGARNGLGPASDAVLRQALAKRPKRRQASCGDFVRELLAALGLSASDHTWPLAALAWLGSGEQALRDAEVAAAISQEQPGTPITHLDRPADIPDTLQGYGLAQVWRRLSCPRCAGVLLELRQLGEVEVDACDACRGLWLDAGELEALLDASLGPSSAEAPPLAEAQRQPEAQESAAVVIGDGQDQGPHLQDPSTQRTAPCPACGEPLRLLSLPASDGQSALEVDHCSLCEGIWLDGGELAALQRRRSA